MGAKGPIAQVWFVAFMLYIGWIVIGSGAEQRIERGCAPISWIGNVMVSMTSFIEPTWESGTKNFFDRTDYACRYITWRLIYGDQWFKATGQQSSGLLEVPDAPPKIEDFELEH
ncbi:hypothetical protein [Sinimarinibacterium sp. NLF-5-8]|uniref:hypothetical protein n=1 Tax=Sinimarinibacterium sp. NLF-5-8 TaxID=2698684 RepID=UPI00137BC137|nr:hypothetical protein [Sinimarinibacterium sp. NLF-5-8]QHS09076.1 hypothetical protein GT972_02210 [Sinimarinibacterium sp. NLF-5-8]